MTVSGRDQDLERLGHGNSREGRLTTELAVDPNILGRISFQGDLFAAPVVDASVRVAMMKDIFGDPIFGFTDIYGWLQLELFHITFWALFGIFAAFLASNIVAKEYESKTIDLLLSTPVSRTELVVNRLIGLIILLIIAILPTVIGCILGIATLNLEINLLPLTF